MKDNELLRRLHLEMAGEPCEACAERPGRVLHHIRYRSQGGDDDRRNLMWLCRECHDAAHGIRSLT